MCCMCILGCEHSGVGGGGQQLQPDFCASLSPDPRERDDFILRISKYITLIRVEPDDIVVMQGESMVPIA